MTTYDAPLSFTPVYQNIVWGGRRLEQWRNDLPDGPVGESWELSQQARGVSVVADGPLAGTSLTELMAAAPEAIVGPGYTDSEFPLLIKVIDANDRLSVQVHPDDDLAKQFGVGERGKTECWYMIGDGGELYQGVTPGTDAASFKASIGDNTVADRINRFETGDGDFFFMPARTIHALGTGCLLFEIQQSCDCTFRVYDWGRVGLDGKPRQLHVDESLATIDFSATDAGPEATTTEQVDGGSRRPLTDCQYFSVAEHRTDGNASGGSSESCSIIMVIDGGGTLSAGSGGVSLAPMRTYLVPAAAGTWAIADAPIGTRFLVALPRW